MIGWLTGFAIKRGVSAGLAGWIGPVIYLIIAGVIFGAGWTVRDAFCDAARLKAENKILNDRISFMLEENRKQNEAAKADNEQAVKDAEKIAELETTNQELIDALPKKGDDTVCVDADVVDRLRRMWQQGN